MKTISAEVGQFFFGNINEPVFEIIEIKNNDVVCLMGTHVFDKGISAVSFVDNTFVNSYRITMSKTDFVNLIANTDATYIDDSLDFSDPRNEPMPEEYVGFVTFS